MVAAGNGESHHHRSWFLFVVEACYTCNQCKNHAHCLLDQVSRYITDGLERARDSLVEAAALRERSLIGRRVAATAASTAESAGENSFRSFMVAVQRCASSVAIVQQYFVNSISRLLLPVGGVHTAACEELTTAMSRFDVYESFMSLLSRAVLSQRLGSGKGGLRTPPEEALLEILQEQETGEEIKAPQRVQTMLKII